LFPPKKKGFTKIRVVYSFIFINALTIKPIYLIYNLKEVFNTLIKLVFIIFFLANITYKYWAILIRRGNKYKVAIIAPNR
jgi:hypothetical protein